MRLSHKILILLLSIATIASLPCQNLCAQSKTTNKRTTKTTKQTQKNQTPAKQKSKSQSEINNLKNKQNSVDKNVKKLGKDLEENRQNTKQNLKELERINTDIKQRNAVIESQGRSLQEMGHKIEKMNEDISQMTDDYNQIKQKYIQLVYQAYMKHSRLSRIMFVLSANSFYEGYRRFDYLCKIATMRREQAEEIDRTRVNLHKRKQDAEIARIETQKLLQNHESEKKMLLVEKEKQNKVISSLKLQEKEIMAELEEQKKLSDQINRKIQDLIAKQAKEAAERARKNQASKPQSSGGYAMTKTEKVVSGGFEKRMGLLPWPVAGTITGHFGKQPHPVLKNITTDNKGIYITASRGAEAKVVYDGVVTHKFAIPGNNNVLIVRHGNFLTVYSNLTQTYVSVGQEVKTGTKVGKIYDDPDNKHRATLFFQVWKEKDLQNPERWIVKK